MKDTVPASRALPPEFGIDEVAEAGRLRLQVRGELDVLTVPELENRVRELPSDLAALVLDLTGVAFIDSSGLRALLVAEQTCRERGIGLSVMAGDGQVREVLRLTRLDATLPLADPR